MVKKKKLKKFNFRKGIIDEKENFIFNNNYDANSKSICINWL